MPTTQIQSPSPAEWIDGIDPRLPLIWEDEDPNMGESNTHKWTEQILHVCIRNFLEAQPSLRVFANLNLRYYLVDDPDEKDPPYISPDLMVVRPSMALPFDLRSYRMRRHGPAPLFVAEVLSERSEQQRDKGDKLGIYAALGVHEYLMVDATREFLPERLLLRRLRPNGTWDVKQDDDGGIISQLGFRVVFEDDDLPRVFDAATGKRFARPGEAQREAEGRQAAEQQAAAAVAAQRAAEDRAAAATEAQKAAEQRTRELEAELERLRNAKS